MLASHVWLNLLDHTTIHVHLVKTLWIACNWICNTCYENIIFYKPRMTTIMIFAFSVVVWITQSVSQLIFITANDFPVPLKLILSVTVQFEFEKQLNLLLFVPVWWGTSPKLLWNLICKFLFYFSKDITHEHPIYDKITSGHLLWATSHHRRTNIYSVFQKIPFSSTDRYITSFINSWSGLWGFSGLVEFPQFCLFHLISQLLLTPHPFQSKKQKRLPYLIQ